jgi:lipooligosaccharide transport system permease protein
VVAGASFGIAPGSPPAALLPLAHAAAIARPLLLGEIPGHAILHVLVLLAYARAGFYAAIVLFRRRLLK